MIPLQGRVALGLDEFMLRLGHLKVLCRVARETGGSVARIQREMAGVLTEETPIPPLLVPAVARYLREKHLCAIGSPIGGSDVAETSRDFRYPDLWLDEDSDETIHWNAEVLTEPRVWRQDFWLADPLVRSRVGGVTVHRGKAASKTGLSHIFDWAAILDVLTASGDLTPEGHLLANIGMELLPTSSSNPYVIGHDRILLAFLVVLADFDVFARFISGLTEAKAPIKKQEGIRCFAASIDALAGDAEVDRGITSSQQFRILQALRELDNAQTRLRRAKGDESSSTAWHRTASRLESYVDLGLLEKGVHSEGERYQYLYYPTTLLTRAANTLKTATSLENWIAHALVSTFSSQEAIEQPVTADDVLPLLPKLGTLMRRSGSPLPIAALSVGVAMMLAEANRPASLAAIRSAIEGISARWPEKARLSRGSSGERAEFISIDNRDSRI